MTKITCLAEFSRTLVMIDTFNFIGEIEFSLQSALNKDLLAFPLVYPFYEVLHYSFDHA